MAYLVLDWKPFLTPSCRRQAAPGQADPFPPPPCHQIVEIGCAWIDDDESKPIALATLSTRGGRARDAREAGSDPSARTPPCEWRRSALDMPVVTCRSMRHGLSLASGSRAATRAIATHGGAL